MKKTALYLALASAFFSVLVSLLLYQWYLPQVNYYQPLNITVNTASVVQLNSIQVFGVTPLSKTALLLDSAFTGRNKNAGLFTKVYIHLSGTISDTISSITITHGKQVFVLSKNDITGMLNKNTGNLYLPDYTKSQADKTTKLYFLLYCIMHLRLVQLLYMPVLLLLAAGVMALVYKPVNKWLYNSLLNFRHVHLSIYVLCVFAGLGYMCTFSFPDRVWMGGDSWDYQSIAVNAAYGKGFPITGKKVDTAAYHFYTDTRPYVQTWQSFSNYQKPPTFYRSPIYPLFIAGVYTLFTTNPRILYVAQFILLIMAGALLPYISYGLLGTKGILPGVFAYALFLIIDNRYAFEVMTEALTIPYTILLVLIVPFLAYKTNRLHAIFMGVLLAMGILLKTCFIPVFIFYLAYIFYSVFISKTMIRKQGITILLAAMLTVAPWTLYANYEALKLNSGTGFFLITTQGEDVLLSANNEYATDGEWHPEWIDRTDSYYNQPELKKQNGWIKAIRFYCSHSKLLAIIFPAKIIKGFMCSNAQLLFYISVLLWLAANAVQLMKKHRALFFLPAFSLVVAIILGYIVIFQDMHWYIFPATGHYILFCCGLIFCAYAFLQYCRNLPGVISKKYWLPALLIVNFLLLTFIFYGLERLSGTVDFIFLLLALHVQFHLLNPEREILIQQ